MSGHTYSVPFGLTGRVLPRGLPQSTPMPVQRVSVLSDSTFGRVDWILRLIPRMPGYHAPLAFDSVETGCDT